MTIDKLMDKKSRENVMEGLIKRIASSDIFDKAQYERLLQAEAERYERDFGHKYVRQFIDYSKIRQSGICWFGDNI